MNFKLIEIVSIPVSDQEAAKNFYQNILGFELIRDYPMSEDARWIQLAPSKNSLSSITLVTWFKQMTPGSVQGLVLSTKNLESDYEVLIQKGVKLSPMKDAPWGKSAMFSDLDGNGWVLQQSTVE